MCFSSMFNYLIELFGELYKLRTKSINILLLSFMLFSHKWSLSHLLCNTLFLIDTCCVSYNQGSFTNRRSVTTRLISVLLFTKI